MCSEVVARGTGHFVAQALSNIVWGSAILEHVSPQTLEVSAQQGGVSLRNRVGSRADPLLSTRRSRCHNISGPSAILNHVVPLALRRGALT